MTRSEEPSAVLCELANTVQVALNLGFLIENGQYDADAAMGYAKTLNGTLKRMAILIIQTQKLRIPKVTVH